MTEARGLGILGSPVKPGDDIYASLRSGSPLNQPSMPSTIWL
jgi:hypothetical protein